MRKTIQKREERERIEREQTRIKKFMTIAEDGFFAVTLLLLVAMKLISDAYLRAIVGAGGVILIPFTCLAGAAVYLNTKLPQEYRIHATRWWSRFMSDHGPVYMFVILGIINVFWLACLVFGLQN